MYVMSTTTTLSVTDARRDLFNIVENVSIGDVYTLTQKGKTKAIIMSAEEYESWVETMDTLRDAPDLAEDIKMADKAVAEGRLDEFITLDELLHKTRTPGRKRVRKTR
jgi:antitoxin YefM